ncbi:MAG: M20/M25/M40 family metallo-hydrolase [Bacteroidota bacterium]
MKRNWQFLLVLLVICTCGSTKNLKAQTATPDEAQITIDVVYLASDLLEGRLTGTKGEAMAAAYISRRMRQIGLRPAPTYTSYDQPFTFQLNANPHSSEPGREIEGHNVVGYLDNNQARTIVIGAHYDHLGMGGQGSRHTGEPAIHNGADDNASGIAAMLDLAQMLTHETAPTNYNFLFIAFSAEELGLIGSKKWVEMRGEELDLAAMFNMDMVGRLSEKNGNLAVYGVGTSPAWTPILDELDRSSKITSVRDSSGVGPTDHTSFYLDSIPVLSFFSGQHNDYHTPRDDAHLIDFSGIGSISLYLYQIIEFLDDGRAIAYQETVDKSQRQAAAFKVSLGVMPDYVYSGEGMRLDGVLADRPAQKAGMERGDVIIKMGDLEVKDIYDYMEGLSQYEVGDEATVIVQRGEEEVELQVRF